MKQPARSHLYLLTILACASGCAASSSDGTGSDQNSGTTGGDPSSSSSSNTPAASSTASSSSTAAPAATTPPPSSQYPGFTPGMPQVMNNGGMTLEAPVLVTIVWPGDPNMQTFEAMADQFGASTYWSQIVSEYGVGPATSGAANHVRPATGLGAKILAADIETIVTKAVDTTTPTWPAYAEQNIYTMFMPAATKIYNEASDPADDDFCAQGYGGYHDEIVTSSGKHIVYAVILQCDGFALADDTVAVSHEWAEASTDPRCESAPGYIGLDPKYLSYDLFVDQQDETGDMCEFDSDYQFNGETDLPYAVQRQWSNKSAAAGHAPCVPSAVPAYWNVTATDPARDTVSFDMTQLVGQTDVVQGSGYKLAVGASTTINFGVYSDGPTDPVDLDVFELSIDGSGELDPITGGKSVTATIDQKSGQNGSTFVLTLNRVAKAQSDSSLIVVSSKLNGTTHYMPILVGDADEAATPQSGGPNQKRNAGKLVNQVRAGSRVFYKR